MTLPKNTAQMVLSDRQRRALRTLFRTQMRLFQDVQEHIVSTPQPQRQQRQQDSILTRNLVDRFQRRHGKLRHHDDVVGLTLVQCRGFIKQLFWNYDNKGQAHASIAAAMEGVKELERWLQLVQTDQIEDEHDFYDDDSDSDMDDYDSDTDSERDSDSDMDTDTDTDNESSQSTSKQGRVVYQTPDSPSFSLPNVDPQELQDSIEQADEFAHQWIESKLDWLPTIVGANDTSQGNATTAPKDDTTSDQLESFPFFPLTGPFYEPGKPLPLFSSGSYYEPTIPGSDNVTLQIFEPRYRAMYQDIMQNRTKRFVVPFAHPWQRGSFARYGLLYQLDQVKEVADETQDVFQFVGQHSVHSRPVFISDFVNPQAYETKETYVQIRGQHCLSLPDEHVLEEEEAAPSFSRVDLVLQAMDQAGHPFAGRARHVLQTRGMWGWVQLWQSCLQDRLLQTELKLATQHQSSRPPLSLVRLQHGHRHAWLQLQLEKSLTVPRLLQQQHQQLQQGHENGLEEILLELVESEKARKPFL